MFISKQLNINYLERKLFWFFAGLLLFSIIFYAYLVNQTILNIVERENIQENIIALSSEVSGLEFDYISLKNEINFDYAYSIGFVKVENVKFASRRLSGQSVSLRDE